MQTISQYDLDARYPTPLIRGARISRMGEKRLGYERADAETCRALGEDQIGWFVGGVPTFDRMIDHVRQVNNAEVGGRWIVVPATRGLAEVAYEQWFDDPSTVVSTALATMWHDDLVTFCVPERLPELHELLADQDTAIAGVVLLDPNCIVHRGRSFSRGRVRIVHDRPQMIVNFRAAQAVGHWAPPLFIVSRHRAAAVSTRAVARVFCLESFQFVEGPTLRSGLIPNISQKLKCESERSSMAAVSQYQLTP